MINFDNESWLGRVLAVNWHIWQANWTNGAPEMFDGRHWHFEFILVAGVEWLSNERDYKVKVFVKE